MKRLLVAGILALVLIGICVAGNRIVWHLCDELDAQLTACEETFGTSGYRESYLVFQEHYIESEGRLSAFVNHGTVEELGLCVARLGAFGEAGGADTFFAEAAAIHAEFEHLKQEETIGWDCLF